MLAGTINNLFNEQDVTFLINFLSKIPNTHEAKSDNRFTGINQEHMLYNWLCSRVFLKIQQHMGSHIKLLFGAYLDETKPFVVHQDYYHKTLGEPYMVFLLPLSVDNDIHKVNKTNTIVFNESDTYVDHSEFKSHRLDIWKKTAPVKENNAVNIFKEYLSHCDVDILQRLTVKEILNWQIGSVIYWDEKLLHCSDNFLENNIQSKQALVMHSYVV